jgi:hypothetical protein
MQGKRRNPKEAGEFLLKLSENARSRKRLTEAAQWAKRAIALDGRCRAARIILEDVSGRDGGG